MKSEIIVLLFAISFLSVAQAQILDIDTSFTESKMSSKNQIYKVKKYSQTAFLEDEKNQLSALNYSPDTLNLSGMRYQEAMGRAMKEIMAYLTEKRKISLDTLPNMGAMWKILRNGQVKEVRFMIPNEMPLTMDDIEEMEKIITKQKVEITHPQYYKKMNFAYIHMPLIWKKPLR
jgi:TolA-binding protein